VRRPGIFATILATFAACALAPHGAWAAAPMCGIAPRAPARYNHVVWFIFENRAPRQIIGLPRKAPLFNRLRQRCGVATRYAAIAHPSLPNYIALTSGATQGIVGDGSPKGHTVGARSVFYVVGSWRSYVESMPHPCMLHDAYPYAVRHNPAAYYARLRPTLCARDLPLGTIADGALASDLATNRLPRFSLVVPDFCHDTHNCSVTVGDRWLRSWVQKIVASPVYRSRRTAIFVTFDENDGRAGNRVPLLVIAPTVRHRATVTRRLSHYALLRTTEELLGLRPLLGHAATARSLRSLFHL